MAKAATVREHEVFTNLSAWLKVKQIGRAAKPAHSIAIRFSSGRRAYFRYDTMISVHTRLRSASKKSGTKFSAAGRDLTQNGVAGYLDIARQLTKEECMKKKILQLLALTTAGMMMLSGLNRPLEVRADDYDDYDDYDDDYDEDELEWDWDDVVYIDNDKGEDYYAYIVTSAHDTNIKVGESTQATASVQSNASEYALEIRWSSSDSNVASVNGDGHFAYIYGKSGGTAYITAALYMEGREVDRDSFSVNVSRPEPPKPAEPAYVSVNGISVSTTSVSLNAGDSTKISASVRPSNANNRGISWNSNNDYVASVGQDGTISAKNAGSAVITARTSENGYTAYVNVTVYASAPSNNIQNVSVNPASVTLAINQYMYITSSVWPANANQSVSWASSNPAVVTVTRDGKITGMAPGTAVITCTSSVDSGKSAKTTVTVGTAVAGAPASSAAPAATTVPVMANISRDPMFCFDITNKILTSAPGAIVYANALQPMSYDANVAAALQMRPDITLIATFPFQGHNFRLTLPPAYNLAAQLDKTGYVEWLQLCTLTNGPVCTMIN